jgi:hypothetical protein
MELIMKKFFTIVASFLLAISLTSCLSLQSPQPSQSSSPSRRNIEFVSPTEILNQQLIGIEDSEGHSIIFKDDGILEITTDEGTFEGNWEYRNEQQYAFRPYIITWRNAKGSQQGYIALISREGSTFSLSGNWYITDAYITLSEKYVLPSVEETTAQEISE